MSQTVLFLCTGNYYRSRFAQILFDALVAREKLDWRAASRGLRIGWPKNYGAMSKYTEERLAEMRIDIDDFRHMPLQCRECDLAKATLVIALKEAEHRAMLDKYFPGWAERVQYWHVHDVDAATPKEALAEIEHLVAELVRRLRNDPTRPAQAAAAAETPGVGP